MPWCPNCKAEYEEGHSHCSDCKVELVNSLEEAHNLEPLFQMGDKDIADRFNRFLEYSDIKTELRYEEDNELYTILVSPKQQAEAKKLFKAFTIVENERHSNDTSSKKSNTDDTSYEEDEDKGNSRSSYDEAEDGLDMEPSEEDENSYDAPSDDVAVQDDDEEPSVYVMKADQYKDLSGTVLIFLLFGLAGIAFVILNITGVISILNGLVPNTVLTIVFLAFLYVAYSTNQKAKQIKSEIEAENQLTERINEWLEQHIDDRFLASLRSDDVSEELNYIRITDEMKEMLIKEFGPQNLAYLDRLIEEYYSKNFDIK